MSNTLKFGNGEWYGKEGAILAYNNENNNYKPLLFDFDRASSATRVNKDGLIETVGVDQPRVDYKDDSKGALLLEPSRTNLFTYSENFSASIWYLNGSATREANATISPDGTLNAYKITSNGGNIGYGQGGVISENSTYEISFFAKKGTDNIIQITETFYIGSSTIFDLENGSITSGNGTIESYSNDWYRCSVSYTYTAGQTILSFNLKNTSSGYFYLFGFQVEQGSYATSYIPTQGSAVTRDAEVCSQTPPSGIINSSEGVLFAEITSENDGTFKGISVSDGTFNNTVIIGKSSVNNRIYGRINVGGVNQGDININDINTENFYKVALKYSLNNVKIFVNGFLLGTDTTSNVFSANTLNKIGFNGGANGVTNFYGNIKQIKYFDKALTDKELQALTS